MMSMCVVLGFLVSCCFLLLLSAANEMGYNGDCPQFFHCGNIGDAIHFPFTNTNRSACGLPIWGCGDEYGDQQIKLGNKKWYTIKSIAEDNSFSVIDQEFGDHLCSENSSVFNYNASLPQASPIMSFQIDMEHNTTLFRCKHEDIDGVPEQYVHLAHCYNYRIYSCPPPPPPPLRKHDKFNCPLPASSCSVFHLPVRPLFPPNPGHAEFTIKVVLSEDCSRCYSRRGQCRLDGKGEFHCAIAKDKKPVWKVILGSTIGCAFALFVILLLYKRRCTSEFKHQSGCHADPYSNPDPESGSVFFGVPVFSYKELEEATNNFHHSRELGNGGFGRVYYGKLRDEREVAVKRLYEQNFRRVEQFMNEIEILTRLRHRNLVSLYGCTSRHSCELMLVYEFVPNGTVACHLHGHLEKPGSMPWSIRMKIAIETAGALTYLHASDIIHRDVKTNNILLDNSFTVKVADFGLSRLFPNVVTHVSTAPQGTPGYVDPEYDQFYQLTSKSDIYSFGVVLIELISSMPAVDITRHRDEINLADLAIKMIKNCAFKELVDPSLGFESDNEVKRMIISVAELAFQCLERDKALRPSMDRVLEVLKKIESGKDEPEHLEEAVVNVSEMSNNNVHPSPPTSPNCDEVGLLKMSG